MSNTAANKTARSIGLAAHLAKGREMMAKYRMSVGGEIPPLTDEQRDRLHSEIRVLRRTRGKGV